MFVITECSLTIEFVITEFHCRMVFARELINTINIIKTRPFIVQVYGVAIGDKVSISPTLSE